VETKHHENNRSSQQIQELANVLCYDIYKYTACVGKYLPNIINVLEGLSEKEYTIIRERLIKDTPFHKIGESMGLYMYGYKCTWSGIGIRPAMWVKV